MIRNFDTGNKKNVSLTQEIPKHHPENISMLQAEIKKFTDRCTCPHKRGALCVKKVENLAIKTIPYKRIGTIKSTGVGLITALADFATRACAAIEHR